MSMSSQWKFFTVRRSQLLDSDLNVHKMYELFLDKHPDLIDDVTMNTIWNIFCKIMAISLAGLKL